MLYLISGPYVGPLVNAFVHTWMYLYYFLAEMGWINRKYGGMLLTPLQIVQCISAFVTVRILPCNKLNLINCAYLRCCRWPMICFT